MVFLFLSLLMVGVNGPSISVPTDLLVEYNLHNTRYGFVYNDHFYLTYLHVTAKIDMGGNLTAGYAKKGHGPGERMGGPIFRFQNEVWCRGGSTQKMVILDLDLEFKREVSLKSLPPDPGQYDIAPGESSVYLLLMEGLTEKMPRLKIQSRNPDDFTLERDFVLSGIPIDLNSLKLGFILGMNYLGDNVFAIYRKSQLNKEYDVYLWNSKDHSLNKLSHLTPQLPSEGSNKLPVLILMASGASSIGAVNRTPKGYAVFFRAKEIDPSKNERDLEWFNYTHLFDRDRKPYKTSKSNAIVLISSGPTDATLVRHPDLGIEVLDL